MEAHRAVVVAEEMPAATAYDITGHEDLWHLCRAVMGRVPDGSILSMMTHIDSGDEAHPHHVCLPPSKQVCQAASTEWRPPGAPWSPSIRGLCRR